LHEIDLATLGITGPTPKRRRRPWGKLAAAVVVLGGLAAGAAYLLQPDPPPPLADIPVSGWAPYWTTPEATATVATNGSILHEVSPFWFEATGAASIEQSGSLDASALLPLIAAIRDTGGLVVPSITDGMPAGGMAALLSDPTQRATHVDTIATFVRDNGFDGIDIDYEQFAFADARSTWETTRPNWVAFITELAAALHADGKVITVSIPPIYDTERTADSGYWVYDYAAIGDVVDRIRIMGYDYSVGEPGPLAPYEWVRTAVKAAKKAVNDDTKVVLGIGMYGRNWVVGTTGTCPESAEGTAPVTLRGVEELAAKRSATPVHDPVTREAEFTYQLEVSDGTLACTQTRQVHYIDEQGVRDRIDLAREERIGGVALWALGFDSPQVWPLITEKARPQGAPVTTTE
jgi:spore germination protein YaaH